MARPRFTSINESIPKAKVVDREGNLIQSGTTSSHDAKIDMVNSPPHYNQGGIECIEAIKAQLGIEGFVAYLRGTIAKYNWRLLHKFDPVEDASKMKWYQDRLIVELIIMKGMKEAGTL